MNILLDFCADCMHCWVTINGVRSQKLRATYEAVMIEMYQRHWSGEMDLDTYLDVNLAILTQELGLVTHAEWEHMMRLMSSEAIIVIPARPIMMIIVEELPVWYRLQQRI